VAGITGIRTQEKDTMKLPRSGFVQRPFFATFATAPFLHKPTRSDFMRSLGY